MTAPKVSVIVPVYNTEKYLKPCVDSLTSQTLRDVEIILVDDGSPDRCGEICD
jgi:glycosyltransferase involved in cell wall biosynthesis